MYRSKGSVSKKGKCLAASLKYCVKALNCLFHFSMVGQLVSSQTRTQNVMCPLFLCVLCGTFYALKMPKIFSYTNIFHEWRDRGRWSTVQNAWNTVNILLHSVFEKSVFDSVFIYFGYSFRMQYFGSFFQSFILKVSQNKRTN